MGQAATSVMVGSKAYHLPSTFETKPAFLVKAKEVVVTVAELTSRAEPWGLQADLTF